MGPLSSTGPGSDLGSKTGAGYKQLPLTIENLALLDDLQQQQHTPAAGVTVNKIHTNEWDRNHVGDGGNWSQGAPQTVGEGVYSALASSGTSDNPSFALSETLYDGSGGLKDATKPQGFNTVDSTVQSPDKFGHTPLDPPDDSPSLEDVGLDSALNFPKPPLDFSTVPKDTSESHSPKGSLSSRSKTKSKSATDEWSGMYCTPTILRGMSQAGSIRSALSSAKSVAMSVRSIFGSGASPFSPSLESPKALAGDYGESKETKRERRRESHNKVERRRRDNINERIQELKQLTPSHRIADQKIQKAVLENPQAANWTSSAPIIQLDEVGPNKGDILNGAVGWIRDLIWMAAVSNQRENMLKAMISEQDRRLIPIWSDSLMRMRSELATIYENDKNKPLEYSRALGTCLYVPPLTTLIGMSREDDRYQQTLEWQEKVFAGLELERQHLLPKPPLSLESNIGPLKPATMPHRNSKSSWSTRGAAILTFLSLYLVLTTIFLGIDSETPHVKQAAILFNGILIVALSLVWARNFEIKAMSAIFRTNKSTVEWLFSPRAVVTRLWKVLPNCYSICRDSHRLARKNISVRRWHTLDPSKTRVMWKCVSKVRGLDLWTCLT